MDYRHTFTAHTHTHTHTEGWREDCRKSDGIDGSWRRRAGKRRGQDRVEGWKAGRSSIYLQNIGGQHLNH